MNKFKFQVPSTLPTKAIADGRDTTPREWLIWWSAHYRHEEGDDDAYDDLIEQHKSFSAEHFRDIGKWKDNAYTETRWRPNVASVAYLIWEQAAAELPSCPEETEVAAFLTDWSNRTYTDKFSRRAVKKRFGLSRATTLLHFVSGGRYPIFDSRVRTAIAALLERPELSDTLGSYMDCCLPLVNELVECCEAKDIRMLDEALFSNGKFKSTTAKPKQKNHSSVTPTCSSKTVSYRGEKYTVQAGEERLTEPQLWDKAYAAARQYIDAGKSVVIVQVSDGHIWTLRPRRRQTPAP